MQDLKIFDRILGLNSLKPSKETNDAFSELVKFVESNTKTSLRKKQIQKLRMLSSIAETEMELYWAKRIIVSENPKKELFNFWYYKNYAALVDLEYANASYVKEKNKNAIFIGGGPFPLTSILLCQKYGLSCTVLEKNPSSTAMATELVKALRLDKKITIKNIDAYAYTDYENFDLVYMAALVGNNHAAKNKIITAVYDSVKSGTLLLCRSSHGTRKLLYPAIGKATIEKIKPILEIRPYNSIINSFFILQKT